MKQKDVLESLDGNDDEENFEDQPRYSSWKQDRSNDLDQDSSKRSLRPYLLLGAGLVALVALLVFFFPLSRGTQSANQLKMLEGRIKNLEERLFAAEGIEKRLAQSEQRVSRLDGLETKLAHMEQQIADLTKTTERAPAPKAPETAKLAPTGQAAQSAAEVRYHQVRPGETLYSIARRYGLRVGELRRLNKLTPEAVIHPGDKLVVSRGRRT